MCDRLIDALRRLLDVLQRGDAGELLAHLMEGASVPTPVQRSAKRQPAVRPAVSRRRAEGTARASPSSFISSASTTCAASIPRWNRSATGNWTALKSRIAPFVRPSPLGELAIHSVDGSLAEGELIMLPHLPAELLALSGERRGRSRSRRGRSGGEAGRRGRRTGWLQLDHRGRRPCVAAAPGVTVTSGNSLTDLGRRSRHRGGVRKTRARPRGLHDGDRRRHRRDRPRREPALCRARRAS